MNPNSTLIGNIQRFLINEPISSEFIQPSSIIPERLRSISIPINIPIVGEEFNSISQPSGAFFYNEEIVRIV